MNEFFAGVILAAWLIFFVMLSWQPKYRIFTNLLLGIVAFVVVGAFYLVPAWLIFMR